MRKKSIINKKKFPFPQDPRLKKVKFIVFGDSHFEFWKQYRHRVDIEEDNRGLMFQYHEFSSRRPCWATAFFMKVNDELTMFVESTGAYMDWFKFESYCFAMCGMKPNPDNHTNSDNLHNHYMVLRFFKLSDIEKGYRILNEIEAMEKDQQWLYKSLENNTWWKEEQNRRLALI